jgi:ketosteroid isomerase-like protein
MSQENVKVVREAWEASERHDNEALFALYDADVEIQGPFGLDDRVFRGLAGVQEFWRDWLASWGELGSDVEEWIDAGDDVIAVMHVWGHGKRSGVPAETRQSHVWTVRACKLWRLRVYHTKDEALKAVGLAE